MDGLAQIEEQKAPKEYKVLIADDDEVVLTVLSRMLGNDYLPGFSLEQTFPDCLRLATHIVKLQGNNALADIFVVSDQDTPGTIGGLDIAVLCYEYGVPFVIFTGRIQNYLDAVSRSNFPEKMCEVLNACALEKPASVSVVKTKILEIILNHKPPAP